MTGDKHEAGAAATLVPNYASPAIVHWTSKLPYLSIAVWCGGLPLVVGTAIFVLWLATDYPVLQRLGLLTTMGGTLLVLVGATCLVLDTGRSKPSDTRRRRTWKRAGAALLLVINFPVAAVMVGAAVAIETSVSITVINTGTTTLDSFVVNAPGVSHELGPILPARRRQARVRPTSDGSMDYKMTQNGTTSTGTLVEYVTSGMGGRCLIRVNGTNVTTNYTP
jgi:hypothetical protein